MQARVQAVIARHQFIMRTLLDKAAKDGDNMASLRHVTGIDTPDTMRLMVLSCRSRRSATSAMVMGARAVNPRSSAAI